MSEATAVSEDALKLLVAEHGVRGTARLLGMDDRQMEAFKRRVSRAGWLNEPAMIAIREKSSSVLSGRPAIPIVPALSPVAAVHAEIASLGSKTRLSLARGIAKAGEHVEALDGAAIVADAGNVKAIAQTADLVHGWKDASPQVKIRLDVLNGSTEAPVFDVSAEVNPSDSWDSASTDVNDY